VPGVQAFGVKRLLVQTVSDATLSGEKLFGVKAFWRQSCLVQIASCVEGLRKGFLCKRFLVQGFSGVYKGLVV